MPTREEITYFGAGPAALPTDVLKNAASALLDYQGTGLGVSN
jgi:phosphoserine aminotransferase